MWDRVVVVFSAKTTQAVKVKSEENYANLYGHSLYLFVMILAY